MTPEERENWRYGELGAGNPIEEEEQILFESAKKIYNTDSSKLLDVGCGIGTITQELIKIGFDTIGIDFSAKAIEICHTKHLNAKHVDVDKEGLPFDNDHFDVVWMGDVLEHVFDPINLLEEANRVLKPGGRLLLSVPNDYTLAVRWRVFKTGRAIQSPMYRSMRQCKHHTYFSWELLYYMLKVSSFKITELKAPTKMPFHKKGKIVNKELLAKLYGYSFVLTAQTSA